MKAGHHDFHEAWIVEQQRNMHTLDESTSHTTWASEFDPHHIPPSSLPTTQHQRPSFTTPSGFNGRLAPVGIVSMNPPPSFFPGISVNTTIVEGKGKGKAREVDFEAAFAQVAASISPQAETSTTDSVDTITTTLNDTSLADPENTEFRQFVLFNQRNRDSLIYATKIGSGTNFRTLIFPRRRKIWQNGNLNSTS